MVDILCEEWLCLCFMCWLLVVNVVLQRRMASSMAN